MTTATQTQPSFRPAAAASATPSKGRTILLWTLSIAAAAMFLMAGGSKLSGAPMMVQLFDAIGVGQWFRYVTGGIEVTAGVGLLVPAVAAYAAAALVATMAGAIATHLFIVGGSPAVPVVLLAVSAFIGWTRWSQR